MIFALYRFYDQDAALLYVGRSVNPGRRFMEHRSTKRWWQDVARIEIEHFASAADLADAETCAIAQEAPLHNRTRPPSPITFVTSDSDPRNGCSEWDDDVCGRPISFQTGLGNYVCRQHALYYSVVVAVPGNAP